MLKASDAPPASQLRSTTSNLCNSADSSAPEGAKSRPSAARILPKPLSEGLLTPNIHSKKPSICKSEPLKTWVWTSMVKGADGSLIVGSVGQNGVIGVLQADNPILAPRDPIPANA